MRQIISGIKHSYSPEEMVGKRVMVVTNLKTGEIGRSALRGMILCAEDAEGKLSLMTTEIGYASGCRNLLISDVMMTPILQQEY